MSVSQLSYLGLNVRDVGAWEKFAVETLGMPVLPAGDSARYIRMDEYHHRVVIHPHDTNGLAYVGWQVSDADECEAIANKLLAAKVEVVAGTKEEAQERKVAKLYKFRDPNGIPSEIFFGPLISWERPFEPTRPISGFVAGKLGLGHIFLIVPDIQKTAQFYCDMLGLRISDYMDLRAQRPGMGDAVFLHCNARHHTLALGEGGATTIRHLMIELKSLDDVGSTHDLAKQKGVLTRSIGRHTNDQMVSFYMKTPSGFDIEYGWGGRLVDDNWTIEQHVAASIWGHEAIAPSAKK